MTLPNVSQYQDCRSPASTSGFGRCFWNAPEQDSASTSRNSRNCAASPKQLLFSGSVGTWELKQGMALVFWVDSCFPGTLPWDVICFPLQGWSDSGEHHQEERLEVTHLPSSLLPGEMYCFCIREGKMKSHDPWLKGCQKASSIDAKCQMPMWVHGLCFENYGLVIGHNESPEGWGRKEGIFTRHSYRKESDILMAITAICSHLKKEAGCWLPAHTYSYLLFILLTTLDAETWSIKESLRWIPQRFLIWTLLASICHGSQIVWMFRKGLLLLILSSLTKKL